MTLPSVRLAVQHWTWCPFFAAQQLAVYSGMGAPMHIRKFISFALLWSVSGCPMVRYSFGSTVSSGDCCFWDAITGLGPSCWSNCLSFPPGLGYFLHLFKDRTADVARRVVDGPHGPPRSIAVCMVYFLDEKPGGSWAEHALQLLGYILHIQI